MRYNVLLITALVIFIFTGCGKVFTGYQADLDKYDKLYTHNLCENDYVTDKVKNDSDKILWTELGGSLKRQCKEYNTSNAYFDETEKYYKKDVDLENGGEKVLDFTTSVLTNDNALDYKGNVYESIMVNTYKGLNFMSLGENANARVEFNRALDRQRRAKHEFKKEIKELQKKQAKEPKNKQVNESKSNQYVEQHYSQGIFKDFQAYPDFINPFTTYISALFYMSDGDYRKARDLLKESVAMDPKNTTIANDFKLVNKILARKDRKKYIWLIYENGQSLAKKEFRLDLPIFLVSSKVLYTGISLPTLKERNPSYEYLMLGDSKTQVIANMDRVIKTEFKIKLPYIIAKSVTRTIAKTVAQAQLTRENKVAGLAMAIFNAATNKSDVRSWTSLPKSFQATRIENKDANVTIQTPSGEILKNIEVPKDKNAIIILSSSVQGHFVTHEILY